MSDKMAERLDARFSRSGMLNKTGKLLASIGLAMLAGGFRPDRAGGTILIPMCCDTSRVPDQCTGCPTTVGECPQFHSWTGYSWTCCYGGQIAWYWDCKQGVYKCYCNQLTGATC